MQTVEYTIQTRLTSPLTVAVAADLHNRPFKAVLDAIKQAAPDMIAVPGDLMSDPRRCFNGLEFLGAAAQIAPVYYSPGNHERIDRSGAEEIAGTGAVLLDNSFSVFRGIYVGGLASGFKRRRVSSFEKTPPPDLRWLGRFAMLPGFKLLLCHHPEYYPDYIKPLDIDIILAGHAHGGQWRFFGRGVFAPGQGLFPALTSGVIDGRMVISRGLANTVSVPRLFNPTELVIVHLVPRADLTADNI